MSPPIPAGWDHCEAAAPDGPRPYGGSLRDNVLNLVAP